MPPPTKRTLEADTEPVASEVPVWLYFCANADHPGLASFSMKDPNHAIERAFLSKIDPTDPNAVGCPVCPACDSQVNAYPIVKEGDIPEAIQKAPY